MVDGQWRQSAITAQVFVDRGTDIAPQCSGVFGIELAAVKFMSDPIGRSPIAASITIALLVRPSGRLNQLFLVAMGTLERQGKVRPFFGDQRLKRRNTLFDTSDGFGVLTLLV